MIMDDLVPFIKLSLPNWGASGSVEGQEVTLTNTGPIDNFLALLTLLCQNKSFEKEFSCFLQEGIIILYMVRTVLGREKSESK